MVTFCVETAFYIGIMEGKLKGGIEVRGRRERRCRKLLDDLKERK